MCRQYGPTSVIYPGLIGFARAEEKGGETGAEAEGEVEGT